MTHTKTSGYKHIFGPVPSRRLGLSLGIDLVPPKTCTLDCVYCESGPTTLLTQIPDDYIPIRQIKAELASYLSSEPKLDTITFSGSGEPLLHSGIGEIIRFIKTTYHQYKIAVLTNGTLLFDRDVRQRIRDVDILKVSLDAGTESTFLAINRPRSDLALSDVLRGLGLVRQVFHQQFWVEVFLVPGLNDTWAELAEIRRILRELRPDQVQLNTLDRPGSESWVTAVCDRKLREIAAYLPHARIICFSRNSVGPFNKAVDPAKSRANDDICERILSTIRRRPCTAVDMMQQLDLSADVVYRYLKNLMQAGKIRIKEMPRGAFYTLADRESLS